MNFPRFAAVFVGAALSVAAAAGETRVTRPGMEYMLPENSPVHFTSYDKKENTAHFAGRFQISGTYYFGYTKSDIGTWLDLYFVPDEAFAKRLPYDEDTGRLHRLRFENYRKFIESVIAPALRLKLERHQIASVSGRLSVVAEGFTATLECGVAYYGTRFVSVEGPMTAMVKPEFLPGDHC